MRFTMNILDCSIFELLKCLKGDLPKIAQKLVIEWLKSHKDELQEMWDKQVITKLPPL